ncbi:FkbM family methyltransferase [Luteimonas vadosa]
MRAPLDLQGSLVYLLARLNPFGEQAWALHRATGLRFRVNVRDVVGRTILRRTAYEPDLTAWLLAGLGGDEPGVFVDVGANIGWFSLQAARCGGVSRVLAVEPDAGNQQLLQANIERNGLGGRIEAVACAAGAEPGLARLHRYKASNRGRHSLLVQHGQGSSWVPVERVDTLLVRLGLGEAPIAAIKVDVEGYEPWVLAGAERALARCEALLVELSPDMTRAGGSGLEAMLDAIAGAGFVPQIWDVSPAAPSWREVRDCARQATVGFRRGAA